MLTNRKSYHIFPNEQSFYCQQNTFITSRILNMLGEDKNFITISCYGLDFADSMLGTQTNDHRNVLWMNTVRKESHCLQSFMISAQETEAEVRDVIIYKQLWFKLKNIICLSEESFRCLSKNNHLHCIIRHVTTGEDWWHGDSSMYQQSDCELLLGNAWLYEKCQLWKFILGKNNVLLVWLYPSNWLTSITQENSVCTYSWRDITV